MVSVDGTMQFEGTPKTILKMFMRSSEGAAVYHFPLEIRVGFDVPIVPLQMVTWILSPVLFSKIIIKIWSTSTRSRDGIK